MCRARRRACRCAGARDPPQTRSRSRADGRCVVHASRGKRTPSGLDQVPRFHGTLRRTMGKLIYMLNVSLDGFVETPDHSLDWGLVDDELHQWFNDRELELDAMLYGRPIYELMSGYWPTAGFDPASSPVEQEYAGIWLDTPKIVFSKSRDQVDWNSRLVRGDVTEELARVREEFDGDIGVGGPNLAAS